MRGGEAYFSLGASLPYVTSTTMIWVIGSSRAAQAWPRSSNYVARSCNPLLLGGGVRYPRMSCEGQYIYIY